MLINKYGIGKAIYDFAENKINNEINDINGMSFDSFDEAEETIRYAIDCELDNSLNDYNGVTPIFIVLEHNIDTDSNTIVNTNYKLGICADVCEAIYNNAGMAFEQKFGCSLELA